MKYKVIVEDINNNYLAYCKEVPHLYACGSDISSVLDSLHKDFLCYLHDSTAEIEIIVRSQDVNGSASRAEHFMQALNEGRIFGLSKNYDKEV
jgi:hypothetical protein